MSSFFKIITLIMLSLVINSCSKVEKNRDPIIEIFSPEHKQQFSLPDTINIKFSVTYNYEIEYIRVSIVDKNMIPISDQEFIYTEDDANDYTIYLPISILPQNVSVPPYYVQVTISSFSQINHTYQEISLLNSEVKYKGCFLIGNTGINTLSIAYFNDQYRKIYSTELSGNYLSSDISIDANLLYLITNTPDRVRAIDSDNGEVAWIKEPQLPYPEFNKILVNNNIVYLSTNIGRIIGLTADNGIQIFNTPILADSTPYNLCITEDYLIADTRLRNSGSTIWATYYKQTGNKYQIFPTNYETLAIYSLESKNRIVAFCNNNSTGQIISFNVKTNNIENSLIVTNIEIQQSYKIDENNFLFSSENKLFHFDQQNQSYAKILETEDIIYDLKFDFINSYLFVTQSNKTEIYSYPGLINIETIETLYQIENVELLYSY